MEVFDHIDQFLPYVLARVPCKADAKDFMQDLKESILIRRAHYESKPLAHQKGLAIGLMKSRLIDRGRSMIAYYKWNKISFETFIFTIQRPEQYAKTEFKEILQTLDRRPNWRGLLLLASGYSVKEVALKMGISMDTVMQRNNTARKFLKRNYYI